METESFTRKEICIALLQYIILRLNYISKTEMIFSKFKRETNVQVIVLWLFGGYKETKEEEKQNLSDRNWIVSDEETHIQSLFHVLDGALGKTRRKLCCAKFVR